MIVNPTVSVSGGDVQSYSITNNTNLQFPSDADAGEIVVSSLGAAPPAVTTENGIDIPVRQSAQSPLLAENSISPRAPSGWYYYFVMPSANVVVELGIN